MRRLLHLLIDKRLAWGQDLPRSDESSLSKPTTPISQKRADIGENITGHL
jgi:hypothetical protein